MNDGSTYKTEFVMMTLYKIGTRIGRSKKQIVRTPKRDQFMNFKLKREIFIVHTTRQIYNDFLDIYKTTIKSQFFMFFFVIYFKMIYRQQFYTN